jgi:mono/diheme cytochrome c family protein
MLVKLQKKRWLAALVVIGAVTGIWYTFRSVQMREVRPAQFGFGRTAQAAEIKKWDIDVRPDGRGLPVGTGDIKMGKLIYNEKCVNCHGNGATVNDELPGGTLFLNNPRVGVKTIGSYWPYATTIFDYVRRTMPFTAPGSLTDQEVYHLTAYLLYANQVIPENFVINQSTLPLVEMPAKKLYVTDDRKGGHQLK